MTDVELSALEAAAKAATPGPWYSYSDGSLVWEHERNPSVCLRFYKNNAAFIAAANPAAVLELIAELRQTRAERDWLAEKNQNAPCELGMKCLHPDSIPKNKNHICDPAECWRELAAKEATCPKN